MEYTAQLNSVTEALRAAEMRQGCTNHSYYAEIPLEELGLPDVYEALEYTEEWFNQMSASIPLHALTLGMINKALAKAREKEKE